MMFNEAEYLSSIKDQIHVELPFTESELTDKIFNQAVQKSLQDLNQLRPKTIKSTEPIHDPNYTLIRSYSNRYDTESVIPFIEEYDYNFGMLHIYTKPWSLEEVSKDRIPNKYFRNLVTSYSGMFMANVRRSADMNSLPFNIKGDQFYSEFSDQVRTLKEDLINHSPNTL